jgi:hypothetical protein
MPHPSARLPQGAPPPVFEPAPQRPSTAGDDDEADA